MATAYPRAPLFVSPPGLFTLREADIHLCVRRHRRGKKVARREEPPDPSQQFRPQIAPRRDRSSVDRRGIEVGVAERLRHRRSWTPNNLPIVSTGAFVMVGDTAVVPLSAF